MKKFLMCLFGIPVALWALLMLYLSIDAHIAYSAKKFDSKAWKIAGMRHSITREEWLALGTPVYSDRRGMYYDLRDNYLKKGMSYEEVEGLLGEWNIVRYCMGLSIKCMLYSMGGGGDSGYGDLVICYDRDKRLVTVGLDGRSSDFTKSVCTEGKVSYLRSGDGPFCSTRQIGKVPCPESIERW